MFSADRFFTAINPLIRTILRSPVHWLLSWGLMLITVTGRRSGIRRTFPVGYQRADDQITVMISEARRKNWWRNLIEPAAVEMRIKGSVIQGTGVHVPADAAEFLECAEGTMRRVPGLAASWGIAGYNRRAGLTDEQRVQLERNVALVRITVSG